MSATFDDYLRELHHRLGMDHNYPATVVWAFKSAYMPPPRIEYFKQREDTGTAHWPLESWYGSDA